MANRCWHSDTLYNITVTGMISICVACVCAARM